MGLIEVAAKGLAIGGLFDVAIDYLREQIPQTATFYKQKQRTNRSVAWCTRVLNKKWVICTNYAKARRLLSQKPQKRRR